MRIYKKRANIIWIFQFSRPILTEKNCYFLKKERDSMNDKKEFSDIFDDDFEVTYEDDTGMTVDMSESHRRSDNSRSHWKTAADYEDDFAAADDDYYSNAEYDDDEYEDDYDRRTGRKKRSADREQEPEERRSSRRKKSRGVPLAAPIRKGGRTLSRLAAAVVRSLTAILILAIIVYVTYTFWRASTPYGDIMEMIRTQQPSITLLSYLCVAVLFLLFELISLLWSMTRVRVRNGIDSWKEDTGRGLFSFILVFASSYLAFLLSPFIPDAPEAVYGVKGALEVYGSMHNVLFGLCAAGVISCIVRKYFA